MDFEFFRVLFFPVIFLLFLLFAFTPVHGQSQVIGSSEPIKASPGDNIILPCHVEPPLDVVKLTIEWSRPDLKPDQNDRLSSVRYVHLYRDKREIPDMKLQSYARRTELFTEDLKQGNISLKIINITLEDEGRYRCFIPKLQGRTRSSIVHLAVEPHPVITEIPLQPTTFHDPDIDGEINVKGVSRQRVIPVGVFILLLMISSVGVTLSLKDKCQKQKVLGTSAV